MDKDQAFREGQVGRGGLAGHFAVERQVLGKLTPSPVLTEDSAISARQQNMVTLSILKWGRMVCHLHLGVKEESGS